uniref:C2H2-type domain-containing protein n=1 Tax=Meloidogyne incognita TaxID=6306 RepID=A0A914M5F5_MELIC
MCNSFFLFNFSNSFSCNFRCLNIIQTKKIPPLHSLLEHQHQKPIYHSKNTKKGTPNTLNSEHV